MTRLTRRDVLAVAALSAPGPAAVRAQPPGRGAIEVAARPAPVVIDPAATAVLVVDMQNDFGAEGGMFHRAGIDISGIQRAIAPAAHALAAARRARMPVVYLKMAYLPDLSDLGAAGSVNRTRHLQLGVGQNVRAPDGADSRVLVRDTWNTDIVAGLTPRPEDIVVYKTRFSGFYGTDLDERLDKLAVRHLIVTGCTTSICVESTVRDAMFRDYSCVVLADCTSEPIGSDFARSNHEASLLTIETLLGSVAESAEFVRAVELAVRA